MIAIAQKQRVNIVRSMVTETFALQEVKNDKHEQLEDDAYAITGHGRDTLPGAVEIRRLTDNDRHGNTGSDSQADA